MILDEYQDTSPLQAAIVTRLTGPASRVYAFADPLQQIYTWRDATRQRLEELRTTGVSEHQLQTLHRYRHRPRLQRWMQQARDVLLDDAARVTVTRPPEVEVCFYDPDLPERGKVRGAESRQLVHVDNAVGRGFDAPDISSIAVLARRHDQLAVLERHLTKRFRCGRLGSADRALEWVGEWIDGYAAAISHEHHVARLIDVARTVVPRHGHLDFAERLGPDGIRVDRLRNPRRSLAERLNALGRGCDTLPDAFSAAQSAIRLALADQHPRAVDWDCLSVLRRVLQAPANLDDAKAAERVRSRIRQARYGNSAGASPRRGLYLLTCHEGKGKEFDLVILPWVHQDNFEDTAEARQLLYVSLSRAVTSCWSASPRAQYHPCVNGSAWPVVGQFRP